MALIKMDNLLDFFSSMKGYALRRFQISSIFPSGDVIEDRSHLCGEMEITHWHVISNGKFQ